MTSKRKKKPRDEEMARAVAGGRLKYNFGQSSIPGTFTIEALREHVPSPVGVVWYTFTDRCKAIVIQRSYVREPYRRCGIRSFLHRSLIEAYPDVDRVVTDTGTDTGEAWLLAAGFKKIKGRRFEFTVKRAARK